MDTYTTWVFVRDRIDAHQREAASDALARLHREGRPGRPGILPRLVGAVRRDRRSARTATALGTGATG